MNGYLLDTNAISELRKRHKPPDIHALIQRSSPTSLFASTLSIGEIRKGIAGRRAKDEAVAGLLERWADDFQMHFADRILPVTVDIVKLWGEWSAQRSRAVVNTLIAATAAVHGLALVTRNVRDVQDLPVQILNPWKN